MSDAPLPLLTSLDRVDVLVGAFEARGVEAVEMQQEAVEIVDDLAAGRAARAVVPEVGHLPVIEAPKRTAADLRALCQVVAAAKVA
jgi:hypothetical protein